MHMQKDSGLVGLKAGPDDGLAEGEFYGYASVFGNVDAYGDVVQAGAFTDTLAEWEKADAEIPLLFGHNMRDPDFNIGHVTAIEDDHGLKVHGYLDLEGPKAMQVYRLLKGRRVNQMSFAFDIVEAAWEKTEELGEFFSLRKLKLYEVSIVPIGANQETEILAVKHLAAAVKAGRVLSAKNEATLRAARDAIDEVLTSAEPADDGKNGSAPDTSQQALGEDQEKASDTGPSPDPEPDGATGGEASREASVDDWAMRIRLLELGRSQ